jgi:hypothetical protein
VERPVAQAQRKGGAVAAAAEAHLKLAVRLLRVELPVAAAQREELQRRAVAEAELLVIQNVAPQFGEKVRIRRSLPELRR